MIPNSSLRHGTCIDVQVSDLRQLFNSMDPSPFRERDLDPEAETFIVDAARELPRNAPLRLIISLSGTTSTAEDLATVPQAVRDYFAQRAVATRTALRRLLRFGGWTLLIGTTFVGATNLVGELLGERGSIFLLDSLVIGAWVALWRPLEILLYDWWPMLGDARLFDRLAAMQVEIENIQ